MLVVGNQRSYSDVCVGADIRHGDSGIIAFDRSIGVVRVRGGTTIYQIIHATGLRPPVVPGTGWATVGGCIANDIHGKNHRCFGTFGHHTNAINLNGERIGAGTPLFSATVGGLGLTGEIVWADVKVVPHNPFAMPWLFPLDYIPYYWPMYKRLGFWQYHCVIPERGVKWLIRQVTQWPLLMVRKRFGDIPSVGMLSFCRPGTSVSMDFAHKDERMQFELDEVVMNYGGAVYPAKTSMSADMFRHSFPRWKEFAQYVHPSYSSSFWRRVSAGQGQPVQPTDKTPS